MGSSLQYQTMKDPQWNKTVCQQHVHNFLHKVLQQDINLLYT